MSGVETTRNAVRVAQSHEKKFMAAKNTGNNNVQYGVGHDQMSCSSLSSIVQGTPRHTRDHDSILNDSMHTPPSRKSSIAPSMDQ